ncbi:MAG TPA: amino acid permease [Gemmatimonadales bacterium]|nr:amino acid permease [Gemmatimonadales bacterium]
MTSSAGPSRQLTTLDAMALVVGIVVGAGIFRTPSVVAANAPSEAAMLLAWLAGGLVSVLGALSYAELASTYPNAGGEYHFLARAYGHRLAFFLGWARLAVIQTGSVALLAFIFGDYAGRVLPLGPHSSAIYAVLVVVALTLVNMWGVRQGTRTQNVLTTLELGGLAAVVVAGLSLAGPPPDAGAAAGSAEPSLGLVMVFVLLTYGGWNEAAYLSAELRHQGRAIARTLLASLALITALYLLVNLAYLRALGLAGMAASDAVAADTMSRAAGAPAALLISLLIAVSALTSANATIFTGARTNYALGRDVPIFGALGRWDARRGTPRNALLAQGAISLALVGLGSLTRRGFQTMVEYTSPVFWAFFLLVGASVIVLRVRDRGAERPFRVPGYPIVPLLFCGAAGYLLYSSLAYTGVGALVGVAVLAAGVVVWLLDRLVYRGIRWTTVREGSAMGTQGGGIARALAILTLGLGAATGLAAQEPQRDSAARDTSAYRAPQVGALERDTLGRDTLGRDTLARDRLRRDAPGRDPLARDTARPREPDVIYVPTPPEVVDAMLRVARVSRRDTVYDLGSGDGRIVIAAARQYGATGVGIDIDPQRIKEARANARRERVTDRVRFLERDLFQTDISRATVVTLYLLPSLNERLRPTLLTLRPGTRVVSHAFDMGDWKPDRQLEVESRTVYYWLVPARVEGEWTWRLPRGGTARARLQQRYQEVRGELVAGEETVPIEGRLAGDSIALTARPPSTEAESGRVWRFVGRVEGDRIVGRMTLKGSAGLRRGRWEARRDGGASPGE